jgi:TldD protein
MDAHVIAPRSYCYVILTAATDEGAPVEILRSFGGEGTFDRNFADPSAYFGGVDELYEQLMQKREGVYADAGEKTVILGGIMTGMLSHEAVGHTVEADLVLGGSVAGPCLHKQVASEKVNLTDFAHTAFGKRCPLPVFVDDEGTPAVDVPLIENGILTGYMNNRESAEQFGMTPGGNARAWLFSDEPLIRMRNTSIHPGTDKLEDMIASIDDGYYLIDSGNGQADTTGEFMFGVTVGYEIKKGKLGRALLDTTISGVAFDMLKTVDMVGDEVVWCSSGFCGKKQPMPVGMGGPALRCKVMIGGR